MLAVQRTGPAKRTANPFSVVWPHSTLIAAVQAGAFAAWQNSSVDPRVGRDRHRVVQHERLTEQVLPRRQVDGAVLVRQRVQVVARVRP